MDAGVRSDGGGAGGCEAGEICLQGRCYPRCDTDADCGPSETCSSSGACTRGVRQDGGRPDGGTPGPCDGVECTAPQVCHPPSGTCGDCSEETISAPPGAPGRCPASGPICDIANARCLPFAPAQCAACNFDTDCVSTDGSFTGTCVLRETLGIREQACFGPCDAGGACPSGLECRTVRNLTTDADVMVCLPPIDMPCTNWLAGVRDQSCLADSDCAPPGATAALYPEVCDGEVIVTEDGGVSTPGRCLQPCGATDDCIDAPSGEQCLGSGPTLFCRIPPP